MSNKALPLTIQTAADLEVVTDYIQGLLAAYRAKRNTPVNTDAIPSETRQWASGFVRTETVAGLESALQEIASLTQRLPVVEVITAAPLSEATQRQVVAWLRQEVNPETIIRPLVRRSLLGGVIIRTSRRAHDRSIATALQQSQLALTEVVHAWS